MNLNLKSNKYLHSGQIKKLKTFRLWAQKNLPAKFKPMIDYTLGWLSPDLLGTGFSVQTQNETELVVQIPFLKINQDFQNEIHSGLVVNAGLEMIRLVLAQHFVSSEYRFLKTEIHFQKKINWTSDLFLKINIDLEYFELKMIELQKNKSTDMEFSIKIYLKDSKKSDRLNYKIEIQKINLLS